MAGFTVITFSVQVGTPGFAIARMVAAQLGYNYYDSQITAKAAELSGLSSEGVAGDGQGLVERIVTRLFAANLYEEELPPSMVGPEPHVLEASLRRLASPWYRGYLEDVVRQIADRGNAIIVGHGSQVLLNGAVLKVLIHGSMNIRAERLAAARNTTIEEATAAASELDRSREDFFQQAYGVDWLDHSLYDLSLNSDHLSVGLATRVILTAAEPEPAIPPSTDLLDTLPSQTSPLDE